MRDRKLSILHVLAPTDVGGLESVVLALARGHAERGHVVQIGAVVDRRSNQFVQDALAEGLSVEMIPSPARSFRPERAGVKRLLIAHRFDVLHSHGYRSDILDLGVARSMRVPTVTTLHGFSATDAKARVYEWLQLRGARRASAVVAVSTNVASRARANGVPSKSLHLIRNAFRTATEFADRQTARERLGLSSALQIGWVGRLSSEKGPDVMMEAMSRLSDLPVTLNFLGDGPLRPALMERAHALGISDAVRFHGTVAGASRILGAFDLIALSSRTEGTPMILLEAMAARVPLVVTSVGGVPDMLSPAEAVLVAPDDPAALADGIRAALSDISATSRRADNALARLARDFDYSAWLDQYEQLYEAIQPAHGEIL